MSTTQAYKLPRAGLERETLRKKGQFWTPDWTADIMAAYVLQDKPPRLLDPALGEGVFFRAAKRYARLRDFDLALFGRDIDPEVIGQVRRSGLDDDDLRNVEIRDFVLDPPSKLFPAIIANPPYIRHHRLSQIQKELLREFARKTTGRHIDGRAGLHVYFLIRALQALAPEGRLAYIVSADICEGVFAHALWQWICSHYRLDAIIAFASEATPFPDVDTNALIFCIRNKTPDRDFDWVKCLDRDSKELTALVSGQRQKNYSGIQVHHRLLSEGLTTGLSRPPSYDSKHRYTLGDFASVMRGIVTGDNEFFFMTSARAKELGIPDTLTVKAVGRMRDVQGEYFDPDDVRRLDDMGRPTRLLNVNGVLFDRLPMRVQKYLEDGEARGLLNKTLIKTRKPWYRMEVRKIPPILFAYLGRRSARFIRNRAEVVPLTCLLCVYPKHSSSEFIEHLWNVLSNPETISNLKKVGKSYGGDAIKVEPRSLERLPLPDDLVRAEGLEKYAKAKQATLFE
ncbi:MAG: SAM-dependent DNA methyltransferase [Armatimonadetes bacterium]|nr:SAM-dependent DNA methyltransferase [Armatimonadota bacterium]